MWGVLIVALGVRLLVLREMRSSPFATILLGDGEVYDAWAQRIVGGDWVGRGIFYQSPLYPYCLAIIYATLGHTVQVVRVLQAGLGAVGCALLCKAGTRLMGRRAGLLAGLLLALYPPAIFYDLLIQKSAIEMLCMCGLLWSVALLAERPTLWRAAYAGVPLGLLTIVRENSIVLVPVIATWLIAQIGGKRLVTAMMLAWMATLAPIVGRNLLVGGEFALTTSQMGPNLYIGNHADATGTYMPLKAGRGNALFEQEDAFALAQVAEGRVLSPREMSAYWRDAALEWVAAQPVAALKLQIRKVALAVNAIEIGDSEDVYTYGEYSALLRIGMRVFHFGILLPLALFGALTAGNRRSRLTLVYVLWAAYTGSVVVFFVLGRYREPGVAMLALPAAAGIVSFRKWFGDATINERVGSALVVASAVMLCNLKIVSAAMISSATHYNLGVTLAANGSPAAAIGEYERALALNPTDVDTYSNLGVLEAARGNHEAALKHYEAALLIAPDYAPALNNLGIELVTRGESGSALSAFRHALVTDPNNADTLFNLANCLASIGRLDEAITEYQRSVRVAPSKPEVRNNLGITLARVGRLDEAIEQFNSALILRPNWEEALQNRDHAERLRRQRH